MPVIFLAFLILVGILIPQNRAYAFGEGAPTIPNANVFGFESSALKVDGPTGALNERISIVIPPGRNGLQPDISLDYSSQRTEDGIVGYGWGLSIPYIQRLNKTGSQTLYASDAIFSSSMDGELVQVSTTTVTHRARVDTGASNSYSFSNNTWTVYDKKGTRYTFGMDDASRQYDTSTTSARTYTWMLTEIRDTNDNTVVFHYTRDGNQLYPSQINYTGSASTEGPLAVTFTTSARADVRESYKAGFKVTTSYRISEIDTLIASSTAGRYLLSYGAGNNGTRSLLTSVQQQGYDEDSTLVSLPATTFTYASSSTMFYAPSSGGDISLTTSAYVAGDTNGNGKNDINYFYDNNNGQGIKSQMYVDQATNVTNVTPPDYWGYYGTPQERGIRYVDINGDGKPDVVRGFQDDHAATTTTALYVNNYATSTNTYGWTASTTYSGTIPDFGYESYNGLYVMTTGLFGEVNGDGLPDYVMALPGYTGTETDLGNGSAWTATTTIFTPPYNMPSTAPTETASQLVDINGDGLDDWVYSSGSNTYTRLNNGIEWNGSASSQWTIATSTLYQTSIGGGGTVYLDRGIRFMDINGDGLPDFVRSYYTPTNANPSATTPMPELGETKVVLLNTGNGWATSTAYTLPYILEGSLDCNCSPNFTGVYAHKEYANWTGNGQMKQDVLTNITSPRGAQKTISYTPSAQLSTNKELPVSLLVVSTTAENDGFGNIATTSYEYSGGKIYLANGIRDRKFAGFAVSTTTAPDSVAVTYYSQGVGLNTSLGEQTNGFAQINRPFRKDIFDLSGVIKKRTYTRWDSSTVADSIFLGLGRELTFDYSTTTTHRDRSTEYLYASTTNNLIRTTEYGEVAGSSDGTFSDIGTDKRITLFTYVASTSVNMSFPRSKTLFDYSNSTTTDERYYYDSLSFGDVTEGNRTTSEKLKSGSTYLGTQNAYNSYGLPTSSTDPRGKVTTYTYDAKNLYVATSTNPLSQTTEFYYDYSLGKPKKTVDANSRVFETVYDGLDRPLTEKQPDIASPTSLVNKRTYAYTDTVGLRKIVETNYLDGSTDFTLYTYLDGLDHVIQTRKEAEDAGQFSVKDFVYNNVGLLQKESLPYFSSGSATTTATATDNLYTRYSYDSLRRITTAATAVGTTTNNYDAWLITVLDPLNNAREFTYDAYGRLIKVRFPNILSLPGSGSGGLALGGKANNFWSIIARATENFPPAIKSALKIPSQSFLAQADISEDTVDPEVVMTADVATTSTPTIATSTLPALEVLENNDNLATTTEEVAPSLEILVESVSTTTSKEIFPSQSPLSDFMVQLTPSDRASFKGREIAKVASIKRTPRKGYDIQIVSSEPIEGGVQVFVRAWIGETQAGFGKDGSVDMERFRIFNPPILVDDPKGDVVRTWVDHETGQARERHLREDPKEALLQVIEHDLSVMKNIHTNGKIIAEKRGNTTDTYYPDASPESTSVDGITEDDNNWQYNRTWEQVHDGDGTQGRQSADDSGSTLIVIADKANGSGAQYRLTRSHILFDTSPIDDGDDISSATLSIYGIGKANGQSDSVYIGDTSPASNTAILSTDMDGVTLHSATSYATPMTVASFSTSAYNDFTLNSSGRATILKAGISKFSIRMGLDFDEGSGHGAPPGTAQNYVNTYSADQTGSANDPKLVVEHTASAGGGSGGGANVTQYEYDAVGNLTKITDADNNVRNFTYDAVSRRLTAEDLHAVGDGTFGTWNYTYDDAGNLTTTLDPKSQTINYTYDDLNRALIEDYTGQGGTEVSYAYDSCAEGISRLCTATSTGAVSSFTYNALGLTASESKNIASTTYVTSYSYNRLGSPTGIVYPDNSEVQYTYNTAGFLETVAQKESGGSFLNLISNFNYAPIEKVTYKMFANGVESTYTYDANALYRLTNIYTVASSTVSGMGGDLGLAKSPWSNIARATKQLPLAFKNLFAMLDEPVIQEATAPVEASTLQSTTTTFEIPAWTPSDSVPPSVVDISSFKPTDTPLIPSGTIQSIITDKSSAERSTIKGQEIAKVGSIERTSRKNYDIQIVSMETIDGGVQVFVRAWKDGMQVGFGRDGSVDMERFRIFNPPILVDDSKGDIVRTWTDSYTQETRERHLREDPKEALLQVIEQDLAVMKNIHIDGKIIAEKRGNTTDTYYPNAGPESTSVDGFTEDDNAWNTARTWAQVHDSDGTQGRQSADDSSYYLNVVADRANNSGAWHRMVRSHILFDTSPIGSGDDISSATLSVYGISKADGQSDSVYVSDTNPASNTAIVATDMDDMTVHGATSYATPITVASFSTSGYNSFSLNSSGLAVINKVGISKFSMRMGLDFNENSGHGSAPTSPTNYVSVYSADQSGTSNDPKLVVEHASSSNVAPSAPTDLLAEGVTNPYFISDPTPEFSAIYNDENNTDVAGSYRIEVATSSTFASIKWDSTKTSLASSTPQGTRIADIAYEGSTLASSTAYYWRIKFWDAADLEGDWSTATSTFVLAPSVVEPHYFKTLQNTTFTYDTVGNITNIVDAPSTGLGKSITYTYDPLYRLTSASTTAATSIPYTQTYQYDRLGSMLYKSDVGVYTYSTTTGYQNPHAPITINAVSYGYDLNGNRITAGSDVYGWTYNNRLASSTVSDINTFYQYDHLLQRVQKGNGLATTTLPSKYYFVTSATTTKQIYTPDGDLVATITTVGATSTKEYVHTDQLGGTNALTDSNSRTIEATDYYPYGSSRIDNTYGIQPEQKKFAQTERDTETNLDYAQARYYESSRGQFISEDPVFWEVGQTKDGKAVLTNPQAQNSYSYAENNPITKKDPNGRCAGPFIVAAPVCLGVAYGVIETAATNPDATLGQYVVGAVSGGIQGGLFEGRIVGGAILGFGSSLAQDYVGGQSLNFQRALVAAGANAVGAGTIKAAVSGVTNVAAQAGGTLSLTAGSRAVASGISGGYQTVTNVSAQRSFAPVTSQPSNSNSPKSTSPSSSGGGFVGQVVNSIKSFVSSIFK